MNITECEERRRGHECFQMNEEFGRRFTGPGAGAQAGVRPPDHISGCCRDFLSFLSYSGGVDRGLLQ
ncbi:hypothetical protein GCM10009077_17310 [Roseibium denhamense]